MSHSKERAEKVCLNCGANLHGRYCHVCGQENIEPKETVWGLITHFAYDITHFDGKFFSTVKALITKPGYLSREYIKGRRASYLHPIRMYVFTSAFFFIIFFSVFTTNNLIGKDNETKLTELTDAKRNLEQRLTVTKDSVLAGAINRSIVNINKGITDLNTAIEKKRIKDSLKVVNAGIELDSLGVKVPGVKDVSQTIKKNILNDSGPAVKDTVRRKKHNKENNEAYEVAPGTKFSLDNLPYTSLAAYDSVQHELPEDKKDGWFQRGLNHRTISIYNKAKNNKAEALNLFIERYMHTLPQALFISLPLFALLLLMLYARRSHYYVDHGIFTIHLYCATFIFLLVYFGINKIESATGWSWLKYVSLVILLGSYFYLYKAMRRFYAQGRFKTIMKFILLNIGSFIIITILTVLFFIISLVEFS